MNRRCLLAAAAAFTVRPLGAQSESLTPLTIAGVPEESIAPALWAAQNGIFRRAGLDVTIQSQASGSAIAAGVVSGSYGIGKSSLVSLITAKSRGVPFVLIAGGGLYSAKNPNTAIVVRSDSPIKTALDLNGKTLAVSALNGIYTLSTRAWMDANGGDSTTLHEVELPIGAVASAVVSGRIDAGALIDPELAEALAAGRVRVLTYNYDAIAPLFMYAGWFCTIDQVAKNRPTVVAFARAMREAASYVNAHPADVIPLLAAFTSQDPARIAKMHHSSYATTLDPKLIQPVIDLCARYKNIPAAFDASAMIATGLL